MVFARVAFSLSLFLSLILLSLFHDIFGLEKENASHAWLLCEDETFLTSVWCTWFDSVRWSYSLILSALLCRIAKRNVHFFGGTMQAAWLFLSVQSIFESVKLFAENAFIHFNSRVLVPNFFAFTSMHDMTKMISQSLR